MKHLLKHADWNDKIRENMNHDSYSLQVCSLIVYILVFHYYYY